jgi:hypothetical protein
MCKQLTKMTMAIRFCNLGGTLLGFCPRWSGCSSGGNEAAHVHRVGAGSCFAAGK